MRERGVLVEKGVTMRSIVHGSILAAAVAAMLAGPSTAIAQAEAPNVVVVTIIQVEGADQAALMDQTKKAQAIWK